MQKLYLGRIAQIPLKNCHPERSEGPASAFPFRYHETITATEQRQRNQALADFSAKPGFSNPICQSRGYSESG
jgi:hypothetical protein